MLQTIANVSVPDPYRISSVQTVDLLLARGSDVTVQNWEGQTPLQLADDKELKVVLRQLKKKGGRGYRDRADLRGRVLGTNRDNAVLYRG